LNESQKVFKEVESIGGKSLAPKTYREAEQALQTANEVIEKDVKDKAAIEKAGKNYEFAAFHALHVTRAVSTLQSLGRSDYEQYILDLEDKLQAIAQAFGYRDIRNHAIGEQIMVLTGLANRVTNEKNRLAKVDPSAPGEEPIDVGKLQAEYEQAQRTIQELNEQIARLQEKPPSDTAVVSEQETQLRKKVVQLEEEVSRLLLENNDLKSRQNRAAK